MHLTSSPVDWYAARAAGIVAYLLLTAVVLVGVGLAGKVTVPQLPRFAVTEVHRFGGLLVGAFVALHVATIAIDSFLPFSPAQLAVPFLATYRPFWTGLGIVAAELLIAAAISNRLRTRLPYRAWRRIHYVNFVIWAGATIHGIGAGTDLRAPWLVARLRGRDRLRRGRLRHPLRTPAPSARAGARPPRSGSASRRSVASRPSRSPRSPPPPGGARRAGLPRPARRTDQHPAGRDRGPRLARGPRHRRRRGARASPICSSPRSGRRPTSLQLEYLPGGQTCVGRVTRTQQAGFDGTCRLPDGSSRRVHATWGGSHAPAP